MKGARIDRFNEMLVFVLAVEKGGFSACARASGLTPSAVSKLMTRLEARLGVRLLHRSTRSLQLTSEGCVFYEEAARILADVEEAERSLARSIGPAGKIRLSTSASYATHILAPILPKFFERFPDVTIDLIQSDQVVDLLAERVDVAIRAGPLKSSALVARKLGETGMLVLASPTYLKRHGRPKSLADLAHHQRLGFGYQRAAGGWAFLSDGELVSVMPEGRIKASDGEALRQLAISGCGLVRLAAFTARNDIAAGRLVPVLETFNARDKEIFHAVHVGQGGPVPSRVRVLLDYLAEHGTVK